ncbi:MAG: carbohydrate binding domain-containing protein, partial [Anaerolineae bacterium]
MTFRRSLVRLLLVVGFVLNPATLSFIAAPTVVAAGAGTLADFEGGEPAGWFVYQGGSTVTTTTQVVADTDALARPGQVDDNWILEAEFNITDYGGFGQDLTAIGGPQDWSNLEGFSFWFYGTNSGLEYQAEIQDNRSDPNLDTAERFDKVFVDDFAGWKRIFIPWSDFARATDFQPGGAPDDGLTLTEMWGWAIVLPVGADTVYFDDIGVENPVIDDFESGLPSGTDGNGISIGFYTFQGAGSTVSISTASTPPAPLLPEVGSSNNVLQVDVDSTSYAGLIHGFENEPVDTWISQDWSAYGGLALWLYGNNSGSDLFIDLLENRNPDSTTDDAERWTVAFSDNFSGWQYLEFPFNTFTRKAIGNSAPNDGLT